MSEDRPPEADRASGAPHPRETTALLGQQTAEAAFLEAFNSNRLHHGWLVTGPRGVGKATLAWRIARFLLAQPLADEGGMFGAPPAPDTLDVAADHPVARRTLALSEPRLFLLRRAYDAKKDRFSQDITVEEARKLKNFFAMSAADGGRRVVIVDAADELNTSAANALLKLLEEPPENAFLLLISHQPSRLLPTIRSRCRELRCAPLGPDDMSAALQQAGVDSEDLSPGLSELAAGSAGEALRLVNLGGMGVYHEILTLFSELPRVDRPRALKLAESCVGRTNEARFELVLGLMDLFLSRLARSGAGLPPATEAMSGEATLMARLAPGTHAARRWAELQQDLGARARHGKAVNLDPAALILDMVLKINETAATLAA